MTDPRLVRTISIVLSTFLLVFFVQVPAAAQDSLRHKGGKHNGDHYKHSFENPERYADDWNDPARDEWQKPDAVLDAMGVEEGMTVADLGTGTGYFVPHLAGAVGENGRVLAVDIEPAMLEYVARLAEKRDLANIDTIRAEPSNSQLPEASVDRILTVNVWHHIPNRAAYSEHLASRLADGGSVWVVDFTKEAPMGPPVRHRLSPNTIVEELEAGGLQAEVVDVGLPNQFVVVGRPE